MKGICKSAQSAANKRNCAECEYKTLDLCNSVQKKICERSFIEGFTKGIGHYKSRLWKNAASSSPKKDALLLLYLSNDTFVLGSFEGWGYSFAVPEDRLHEKVEVVAWLYVTDLL